MRYLLSVETQKTLHDMASLAVSFVVNELLSEAHQGKGAYYRAFVFRDDQSSSPDYRDLVPIYDSWVVGEANRDRESVYQMCSFEKAVRTVNNFGVGHVSSYQSRIDNKLFVGAIMFRCIIPELGEKPVWVVFSISGLPEMGDEAAALITAEHMNLRGWTVNIDDLRKVVKISANSVYKGTLTAA